MEVPASGWFTSTYLNCCLRLLPFERREFSLLDGHTYRRANYCFSFHLFLSTTTLVHKCSMYIHTYTMSKRTNKRQLPTNLVLSYLQIVFGSETYINMPQSNSQPAQQISAPLPLTPLLIVHLVQLRLVKVHDHIVPPASTILALALPYISKTCMFVEANVFFSAN